MEYSSTIFISKPRYFFRIIDYCIEHIFKRIISNMKVGFEDYSHATLPSSEINFRNISNDQLGVLFQMFSELNSQNVTVTIELKSRLGNSQDSLSELSDVSNVKVK